MNKSIQPIHIYCLLFLSVSFLAQFMLTPTIISEVERASWLSAIVSLLPFLVFAIVISRIASTLKTSSLPQFISRYYNKPLYGIVIALYVVYILFSTFMTLKFTMIWIDENFAFEYPYFINVLLFILLCFYGSQKGIKTIAIQSFTIGSIYILLFALLNIGNSVNHEYQLLLPINHTSISSTLIGVMYMCIGILEVGFLLFVVLGHAQEKVKFKGIIALSTLLLLLTFITITSTIAEFGLFIAQRMTFPVNEQWKVLSFGKYLTRLDSLSVFHILSISFIRISLFMYILSSFFKKNRNRHLLLLYLGLTLGLLIPWSVSSFILFINRVYLPAIFMFLFVFMIVTYILLRFKRGQKFEQTS
ncbi:GerAB/ArcD/ProY family transporter [Lysinibacillus parviboronicapiens]|uniref:GerAB/ArcD/ProY family transporter n=1 Tax=Lysinibacillus parviboronicapiens TaxID=436516 RepID=UPI000D39FEBD|nr:GerAB/ArcD/ProY family transporter [Lysinibacillus parviboronicapiens]